MEVTFCQMCPEHLDHVLEIERSSYAAPWSRQVFFSEIQNKFAHYIVAMNDGLVVGYIGMWLILDEAQVTNIAVHPSYRSKNIGRMLMLEMTKRAVLRGINRMTLEVRPSNLAARHLYTTMGFIEKGIRKRYYTDNNEDAIIMWNYDLAGGDKSTELEQSNRDCGP
ncbi:MAG: ribosomal-protein-alanine N-acetyltransferase [Pelotomaculum sp. PtaB.Bin104]|nr:MAG: ribosomal-protein-alanine N-acetyltransferase [Pelotomaculum sp. PtaB.Bin104]